MKIGRDAALDNSISFWKKNTNIHFRALKFIFSVAVYSTRLNRCF